MGAKMGAAAEGMFTGVLILSVVILSINMVFCLLRAVLGPRFSDRLIAINMIGTKTVLMIALLIKVFHEDYLVDICLIYALISFQMCIRDRHYTLEEIQAVVDECSMVGIPVWSHAEGYGGALDSARAGVHLKMCIRDSHEDEGAGGRHTDHIQAGQP